MIKSINHIIHTNLDVVREIYLKIEGQAHVIIASKKLF